VENNYDLRILWNALTPKDRASIVNKARTKVTKLCVEIAQMRVKGEISDSSGKLMMEELVYKSMPWKILDLQKKYPNG